MSRVGELIEPIKPASICCFVPVLTSLTFNTLSRELCRLRQAMEAACKGAIGHAEASAVQAVAALAHPSWTPAVIGAAAAIAADSSVAACARRLAADVSIPNQSLPSL